tara:strand:- start:3002 stop:3385 length:384 start_codon:yes stop_codon:yes gene_type:complete
MPDDAHIQGLRKAIRSAFLADEGPIVRRLISETGLSVKDRGRITDLAAQLVRTVRTSSNPNIMGSFLSEYDLNTTEGIALMCLSEALLRVPDAETIDALISEKLCPRTGVSTSVTQARHSSTLRPGR